MPIKAFQFHKVRLKAGKLGEAVYYRAGFQFHKVRLKGIRPPLRHPRSSFQFHKVRLKAHVLRTLLYRIAFQFHKVRLKDYRQRGKEGRGLRFNSIRYD